MAAILASSSVAGLLEVEAAVAAALVIWAGPRPVGRAVSVRGWKKRFPGAAGTRFTITEVFFGIIRLSSKYSIRRVVKEVLHYSLGTLIGLGIGNY